MTTLRNILILNGPNLNLLGTRQPEIYGSRTLKDLEEMCVSKGKACSMDIKFEQSNSESKLVALIQEAINTSDGIIINAAGYTHTSVAILDSLLAIKLPTIELHITNIYNREEFRKKSLISKAAQGIICGFGINGYIMALDSIKEILKKKNENK